MGVLQLIIRVGEVSLPIRPVWTILEVIWALLYKNMHCQPNISVVNTVMCVTGHARGNTVRMSRYVHILRYVHMLRSKQVIIQLSL